MNNFRVFGSLFLALFWALCSIFLNYYGHDAFGALILALIFLSVGLFTDDKDHPESFRK